MIESRTPRSAKMEPTERSIPPVIMRSEEHTSELQSPDHLVCRLLLEKKKKTPILQYRNHQRCTQHGERTPQRRRAPPTSTTRCPCILNPRSNPASQTPRDDTYHSMKP